MKKILAVVIVFILIASAVLILTRKDVERNTEKEVPIIIPPQGKTITQDYTFSYPIIEENGEYANVYIEEADFYDIHHGRPTIPVKTNTYEFPLGTEIINVSIEYQKPETIEISKKISPGSCSTLTREDGSIYNESAMYPPSFLSYSLGGGLSNYEHKTILTIRVNPFIYNPVENSIDYIKKATVKIIYKTPEIPVIEDKNEYELLIITVSDFKKSLQPLVNHKEKMGIKTKLITIDEIKDVDGRDTQEQIKYYIKEAIETIGIKYVLLVGGLKGQSTKWNLPIRYSHVLMTEGKQENLEPQFISDLYYADIYDSEGNFSSWDTNNNDIFAEWEGSTEIDKMDLYPDVFLGRLPCMTKREVKIVVDKIIDYEKAKADESWFKKIILFSGDHWKDPDHISEGVLIMDKASEIMNDFTPVKLYATETNKILVRDVNKVINKGAGFMYFSGHGGATAWGIHYPPDATGWAPTLGKLGLVTFYNTFYMNFLRNKNKLPVTVVGGCFNGKFDISIGNSLKNGKLKLSSNECWAWKLASKKGGGSISTIANTGLGTHSMGDADKNGINDYLESLDGWLELRFFQLYKQEQIDVLGDLHSGAIRVYLNTFLCTHDEMDVKMVQQWQLFGDPSLKVGGY